MTNKTIYNDLATWVAHVDAHKGIKSYTEQCIENAAKISSEHRGSKIAAKIEALKVTRD